MIKWSKKPKFLKTYKFMREVGRFDPKNILEDYGKRGVSALAAATPVDTGETSRSWFYKLEGNKERYTITWYNSVMAGETPLVIILQYGHATKSGYFLQGQDFINPALRPIYKSLARRLGQEII
jgi:hypothetical protein